MHFKITFIIAELFNATSTVNSNFCTSTSLPTRRTSIRQAEKRARKNLPPVLSPIRSPSPPKVPRRGVPIQEKTPKFLPRRNPLPEKSGCENITNLNVNIGQRGKKPKRMHLPPDLIRKFAQLSERNTNQRKETGGILAGVQRKGHYQVTPNRARANRWAWQVGRLGRDRGHHLLREEPTPGDGDAWVYPHPSKYDLLPI